MITANLRSFWSSPQCHLFPVVRSLSFEASQARPSSSPAPVKAHVGRICQGQLLRTLSRSRMFESSSVVEDSLSCLLAKTRTGTESFRSEIDARSCRIRSSSFLDSENRFRSDESTTKMMASFSWRLRSWRFLEYERTEEWHFPGINVTCPKK